MMLLMVPFSILAEISSGPVDSEVAVRDFWVLLVCEGRDYNCSGRLLHRLLLEPAGKKTRGREREKKIYMAVTANV